MKTAKNLTAKYEQRGVMKGYRCRLMVSGVAYAKVWNTSTQNEAELLAAEWKAKIEAVVSMASFQRSQWEAAKIASGGKVTLAEPYKPTGGNGEEDIKWILSLTDVNKTIIEKAKGKDNTILDALEKYKQERLALPKKEKSKKCFIKMIKYFSQFVENQELPNPNDKTKWQDIFKAIKKNISNSHYKDGVKNDFTATLSAFISYLHKESIMEDMPRRRSEIVEKINVIPNPTVIPVDDLAKIWANATDLMKSYIIMSLNFGFYMADIGQLKQENIDLDNGRLFGVREKTKETANVKYNFPMWEPTKYWIKNRIERQKRIKAKNETGYLFTTKDGSPVHNNRNKCWTLLVEKAKVGKPYMYSQLRDTAATEMEKIDSVIADIFLRHSSANKMKRHYVEGGQISPTVDAAIMKLQESFPFLDTKQAKKNPLIRRVSLFTLYGLIFRLPLL